jgi:hypothetical protein
MEVGQASPSDRAADLVIDCASRQSQPSRETAVLAPQ